MIQEYNFMHLASRQLQLKYKGLQKYFKWLDPKIEALQRDLLLIKEQLIDSTPTNLLQEYVQNVSNLQDL